MTREEIMALVPGHKLDLLPLEKLELLHLAKRGQQSHDRDSEVIKERDVWCEKCLEAEDRERVLQEKLDKIQETHTDNEGHVWEAPTSYAYYTACSALYKYKDRERMLREALENITEVFNEKWDRVNIEGTDWQETAVHMSDIAEKALETN